MKENKDRLVKLMNEEKAVVMICGKTKMGQDVQLVLKEWLGLDGFKTMEMNGRIVKELWTS